uniref:Coiled-coil serine-rich protein 1 n=1 Tax=Xiphophorus couchianus TaxID=32473 RepID=A0A3B5LAH0_9TELE
MGESGSRRSTLVSRLPIFRRSASKRQESLPSSPSSGGVGNGVHTSSPSSTNSSSGSTGKRRSLFRAPSLSFTAKRNSDPRTVTSSASSGFGEGGRRSKSRHSFGFGSHKQKKIPRSQTEDFDKASSSSSATNRNVFINCISSSEANEGDDSGFLDDFSGASNNNKRSSRQKKQLLPKSFSAHHRFSRTSDHHRPPEVNLEPPSSATVTPGPEGLTPGSCPGELMGGGGESSLQSPMISEDRTTAITPSEFIPITEDSVSEVDALPAPSPGSAAPENLSVAVSTSQVLLLNKPQSSAEKPLLPDTSTANNTDYETAVSLSEPETAAGYHTETTSESEVCGARSEGCHSNPEKTDRRARHTLSLQERGSFCGCHEPRSSHLRKPHAASVCSSASPYHEVMRMERRLRSSSEGAGGPRVHGNYRDAPGMEGNGLLKHRNNSSSSKLGSLDVLNNLGSSELDEDDLMLDLDLSDDQRHRHVSREDSSQSLTSCLNLLPSPLDPPGDRLAGKENVQRELSRPTSLLPTECIVGPGLGKDDDPLPPGLESLPLRLMQQECTAVKTLLLRLRRTLQESTETSPASSLQSLPISPCSEKSLPLKVITSRPFYPVSALCLLVRGAEERHQQGAGNAAGNLASGSSDPSSVQTSPTTPAQTRGGDHHPPSLIPRAVGASASSSLHSLASRGSSTQNISSSDRASPTPPTPSSASSSSSSSAFTGRLGQPPRGPLSLHSYSRKNVFLQHSLHTAELQALTQRDS